MTEVKMKEFGRVPVDECDDIAPMIDAVLGNSGCRIRYAKLDGEDWISCIGDSEMEEGIRELPEIEQQIVEMFFMRQLSLMDISVTLDIPEGLLIGHIKAMRIRLECYV